MHWQMVQSYRDCDVQELQKSTHSCCKRPRLWSILRQSGSTSQGRLTDSVINCNNHRHRDQLCSKLLSGTSNLRIRRSANLQLSPRLILPPNTNMNRITMVQVHRTYWQATYLTASTLSRCLQHVRISGGPVRSDANAASR